MNRLARQFPYQPRTETLTERAERLLRELRQAQTRAPSTNDCDVADDRDRPVGAYWWNTY